MPRIDPKVKAAIGLLLLGATSAWKVADRYFGDQRAVATALSAVDRRLAVIEIQLADLRRRQ